MTPAPSVRPPGRPRSEEAERRILETTVQRFIADGYQGMSMEQIAAHAGVGKATIYRRWPSKEALISDAVASLSEEIQVPNEGSVREDLLHLVRQIMHSTSTTPSGQCFARMAGEALSNPELFDIYRRKFIAHRRAIVATILRRGMDRGELRDDLDIDLVVDMMVGPIVYRRLIVQMRSDDMAVLASRLIDTLMEGIAPA